jgi:hypothetical protein
MTTRIAVMARFSAELFIRKLAQLIMNSLGGNASLFVCSRCLVVRVVRCGSGEHS